MKILLLAVFTVLCIHQVNANEKLRKRKEIFEKFKGKALGSNEKAVIFNQTFMKINKRGGKMTLVRKAKSLQVQVKSIVEKYANETVRSNVILKDLDCTVKKDAEEESKYGINATVLSLECNFPNSANAALEFYLFKASGTIDGEDDNQYEIKEGGVKMNIQISNWPNEAEILDVTFGMKCGIDAFKGRVPDKLKNRITRRRPGAPARRAAQAFSVCPEARGTFAANYKDGGNDKDMPEDYPKANDELKDSEAEITLRFSGRDVVYDPTMEVGDDVMEENANSAMSFVPNMLLMVAVFIVGQMKLF
eukprot:TCONS_00051843-protein